jgi:hypothetical protein
MMNLEKHYRFKASCSGGVLGAKVLFTNAKHKVKKKSFKSGIRENILGYGLPNDETFNKEFLNFGVIIPHGNENQDIRNSTRFYEYPK